MSPGIQTDKVQLLPTQSAKCNKKAIRDNISYVLPDKMLTHILHKCTNTQAPHQLQHSFTQPCALLVLIHPCIQPVLTAQCFLGRKQHTDEIQ